MQYNDNKNVKKSNCFLVPTYLQLFYFLKYVRMKDVPFENKNRTIICKL